MKQDFLQLNFHRNCLNAFLDVPDGHQEVRVQEQASSPPFFRFSVPFFLLVPVPDDAVGNETDNP